VSQPVRVLVADDQALLRSGFALILNSDPGIDVVGEAANGLEVLAAARRLAPDLVLMDIQMPEMDGIEATRHLTSSPQTGRVKVLVLTTFDADEYVYHALRAGASGFLLKDTAPVDLIAAVRTVAAGEALLSPLITRRLIEQFVRAGPQTAIPQPAASPLPALTQRETDVLAAVARGLSNVEIAGELYLSYSTVKTHVSHLLAKLGARDRAQLVMIAFQSGIAG
jgi:DNA-binding NarL/FixJ family response regulator